MRIARKLVLIAAMAASMVAMSGETASATALEFRGTSDEDTTTHCPIVVESSMSGGCHLKLVSSGHTEFRRTAFPVLTLRCNVAFDARVNETGHGYIYNHVFFNCAEGAGTWLMCNDAMHPAHWEFQIDGTGPATYGASTLGLCIAFSGLRFECNLTNITLSETTHTSAALSIAGSPHKACDNNANMLWSAAFTVTPETGQELEIVP